MVPAREAAAQEAAPPAAVTPGPASEPHRERVRRHTRRQALYLRAGVIVLLLAVLIALVAANTRSVELDWVVGTGHASLVWIIFAVAVIGWLLGIATGAMFRRRTRRRAAATPG